MAVTCYNVVVLICRVSGRTTVASRVTTVAQKVADDDNRHNVACILRKSIKSLETISMEPIYR